MIKTRNADGVDVMRHKMCSCGRERAVFGQGDEARCIKCVWERTTRRSRYGRANYKMCSECGDVTAVYETDGRWLCHWCRREALLNVPKDDENEEEGAYSRPQVSLVCEGCGETFTRNASNVRSARRQGQQNFFCSQPCFQQYRQLATEDQDYD